MQNKPCLLNIGFPLLGVICLLTLVVGLLVEMKDNIVQDALAKSGHGLSVGAKEELGLKLHTWKTALVCMLFAMGGVAGALCVVVLPMKKGIKTGQANGLLKDEQRSDADLSKKEAERLKWKENMQKAVAKEEARDKKAKGLPY